MEGLEKLKTGEFNHMGQEWLPDGSVIITLSSRKYPEVHRFRVKDLYGPNEEVIDVDTGEPIDEADLREALPQVQGGGGEDGQGADAGPARQEGSGGGRAVYRIEVTLEKGGVARYDLADATISPGADPPPFTTEEYEFISHMLTQDIRLITRAKVQKIEVTLVVDGE